MLKNISYRAVSFNYRRGFLLDVPLFLAGHFGYNKHLRRKRIMRFIGTEKIIKRGHTDYEKNAG